MASGGCHGVTTAGGPCGARALAGRRGEWSARGGTNRSNHARARKQIPGGSLTIDEIHAVTGRVLTDLNAGKMEPREGKLRRDVSAGRCHDRRVQRRGVHVHARRPDRRRPGRGRIVGREAAGDGTPRRRSRLSAGVTSKRQTAGDVRLAVSPEAADSMQKESSNGDPNEAFTMGHLQGVPTRRFHRRPIVLRRPRGRRSWGRRG